MPQHQWRDVLNLVVDHDHNPVERLLPKGQGVLDRRQVLGDLLGGKKLPQGQTFQGTQNGVAQRLKRRPTAHIISRAGVLFLRPEPVHEYLNAEELLVADDQLRARRFPTEAVKEEPQSVGMGFGMPLLGLGGVDGDDPRGTLIARANESEISAMVESAYRAMIQPLLQVFMVRVEKRLQDGLQTLVIADV
jgi:hypothetical protein